MQDWAKNWWAVSLQGGALVFFGLLCLFYPLAGVASLVLLFGAFAIIEGAFGVMAGYEARSTGNHANGLMAIGFISVLAGIMAFVLPGVTLISLYALIAAWAVVTGVMRTITAIRHGVQRSDSRLMLVSGIVSVIFGAVLFMKPAIGLVALAIMTGVYAIASGVALLTLGAILRDVKERVPAITFAPEGLTAAREEAVRDKTNAP